MEKSESNKINCTIFLPGLRVLLIIPALWLVFSCMQKSPSQDALIRKISEVEATALEIKARLKGNELAQYGYLDVTAKPYNADNSGATDATSAIQQALKDARDARMICYLPAGRYLVSNTITGIQGTVEWNNWPFEGFADPWLCNASFEYPNVITGSPDGERTVIILSDGADGFADPQNPKPVFHFWSRMEYGNIDKTKPQPNINFNQKIISIDIDLGKGNPGAVAIHHQGAEGSTIENVRINASGAFAGIQSAPGSGGGIFDVKVTGGRYGFYFRNNQPFRGSQPSPLVAAIHLTGQTEDAILFDGRGPLTITGATIEGAGIRSDCPENINWNGALNIVDAVILPDTGKTAVVSNHSVVLENVYIAGTGTAVQLKNENVLACNQEAWLHVRRWAAGVENRTGTWAGDSLRRDEIWINGKRISGFYDRLDTDAPADPENLRLKHCWPSSFPNGLNPSIVNVMKAPYLAKGDGITDDSDAIQKAIDENEAVFLPKGTFAISKPLQLHEKSRLTGLGNIQTVITTTPDPGMFSDPDNPLPLIETVADKNAETQLGFLKLLVPVRNPCVYALRWRAGRNSVVRNVYPIREPSHPHGVAMGHPMVKIDHTGGGKWFNNVLLHWWDQSPSYRHLLIENTTEPLVFYMLEPQHGRSEFMVEIKNASNVDVFSIKSECDFNIVKMDNCSNIRIFGYAGNGMPHRDYALFNVINCSDFLLANINPQHKAPGHYGALGIAHNPDSWFILHHTGVQGEVKIRGTEQFSLYLDGFPDGSQ